MFIAKPRPFEGGFGVFDDCLPDGWGLLVLDRYLQKKGINPRTLTLLDRLAIIGSTGRGALEFRPDRSVISDREYVDFEKMALEAEQILDSEEYRGDRIEEFQYRGGSPGGARPKIFARHEGKEWLVKFRAKADSPNIGKEEYRYSLLAKKCGIEMPEHGCLRISISVWSVLTGRRTESYMWSVSPALLEQIIACPALTIPIFFRYVLL